MAAAACLSVYHFARQFKPAAGLPPHQYVILRRVERAKQRLLTGAGFSLTEVAARRLLGPGPVHPPLQTRRRRHAGAVPDARKNRPKNRRSLQERESAPPYHSP
jgi:AraC family transcriptional regulator